MWFVYALSAAACWGLGYTLVGRLLSRHSSAAVLLIFSLITLATAAGFMIGKGHVHILPTLLMDGHSLRLIASIAVALGFANLLTFMAIKHKSAPLAAMGEVSYPLFTALFAWLLFGEPTPPEAVIGGAIAIVGIAMIFRSTASGGPRLWLLYALAAAAFWGLVYSMTEQLLGLYPVSVVFLVRSAIAVPFALVVLVAARVMGERVAIRLNWRLSGLIILVAATMTAANLFSLMAINAKSASIATMVEITYPLFTALFTWLAFRQKTPRGAIRGGMVVVAGIGAVVFTT